MLKRPGSSWTVVVLAVLALASGAESASVSMWDFEGTSTNWSWYFDEPIPDQWNGNDAVGVATKEWAGVQQGAAYARMGQYPTDRVTAPTDGMSVEEGTLMFMWRYWLPPEQWRDMVSAPVTRDGTNPMRFEHMGGNSFTIYGGPDNGGNSVDIDFLGALDGQWHTFAVTWKDGETVKAYFDGAACMETDANYVAADYQLLDHTTLGNRKPADLFGLAGDYDYWMVDSACLDPCTIADYHANGYDFTAAALLRSDIDEDYYVNLKDFGAQAENWGVSTDPFEPNVPYTPVSLWTFNGAYSEGDPEHNYRVPVQDDYGTNDGWISGVLIPVSPDASFAGTYDGLYARPYEGDYAWRSTGAGWSYFFVDTLNGFSKDEGTYMWAYRANQYTSWAAWKSMLGTHLYLTGGNPVDSPMRLEINDGGVFSIVSGPTCLGNFSAGVVDTGPWHTIALTYADGENVKVYVDGVAVLETTLPYVASQYSERNSFYLGNRTVADAYQGDYDYMMYDDEALSVAVIQQLHEQGYGVICDGKQAPAGDLDFDCGVGLTDLAVLAGEWLQCSAPLDDSCLYGK